MWRYSSTLLIGCTVALESTSLAKIFREKCRSPLVSQVRRFVGAAFAKLSREAVIDTGIIVKRHLGVIV